ncbi:MAG: metallophosphoesterase [Alphaproteobacteria bacterium]|nr:metallophosphoesterase [Alphaproteobacteria bacterium]
MNFTIAVTISLLGCCVTIPLFFRYGYDLNIPTFAKWGLLLLSITIATLPVFAMPEYADIFGKYFHIIQHIFYFIYIFAVILFTLTLLRDFIWMILSLISEKITSPLNMRIVHPINLITIIIAFFCTISADYEGKKIPQIKTTTIFSDKITENKKIVILSDLHLSRTISPEKIKEIVKKTNEQKPDAILLVGDIIDDDVHHVKPLLNILKNLSAPDGVFFTSGNHEFYVGYSDSINLIKTEGLKALENESVAINNSFYIGGIPDIPSSHRFNHSVNIKKTFKNAPDSAFKLLMSHTPVLYAKDEPFDLVVSGHTHGGQIFPFHIFSWLYNHHYLAGLYRIDDKKQIYVSRGTGQWGPQMRFLAPAEISVIHINKKGGIK